MGNPASLTKLTEMLVITSLTAKANAIKMLQARLNLLSTYLAKLPPSYLIDDNIPLDPSSTSINHQILRSISALLARLPLLTPPDTASFVGETQRTKSDVELITLLSSLTRSAQEAKELGRKWSLAEPRKSGLRSGGENSFGVPGVDRSGSQMDDVYFDTPS